MEDVVKKIKQISLEMKYGIDETLKEILLRRVIRAQLNPKEILCLFNYLNYVIAMRHHAVIFALLAKKPIVALVYGTKTLELLNMLNRNDINIILVKDFI